MDALRPHPRVAGRRPGLGPADQPLHQLEFGNVDSPSGLRLEESANPLSNLSRSPLPRRDDRAHIEGAAELLHEIDMAICRLIPDGNIAAGLVGDMNLMPVLAEADEGAPHADHVIIWVWAEDDHPLGKIGRSDRWLPTGHPEPAGFSMTAGRPARDRVLHRLEHIDVDVVGTATLGEQFLEPVLVVVAVGEFEDRLVAAQRQPDHCFSNQGVGPLEAQRLERPHHPRRLEPRQPRGGGAVEHKPRVGMLLEGAGRNVATRQFLHRLSHNRGLVLAKRQQNHAAGIENRAHAHGDRLAGHVSLAEEVAGCIGPRHTIERDQPGSALGGAPRLVETDVAGAADAQNLEVDSSHLPDLLLVATAGGENLAPVKGPIGDMDGVGRNVDMVEEMFPHEAAVALQLVGLHRPVFVEVERDNRAKGNTFFAVQTDEFVVDADRRATGRQSQHRLLAGRRPTRNQINDLSSNGPAGVSRLLIDGDRHPLHGRDVGERSAVDRRTLGQGGQGRHG